MKKIVVGVCAFVATASTQASCLIHGCKWAGPETWLDAVLSWFI